MAQTTALTMRDALDAIVTQVDYLNSPVWNAEEKECCRCLGGKTCFDYEGYESEIDKTEAMIEGFNIMFPDNQMELYPYNNKWTVESKA